MMSVWWYLLTKPYQNVDYKKADFTAGDECRRLMILQVSEQIQENLVINIPVRI